MDKGKGWGFGLGVFKKSENEKKSEKGEKLVISQLGDRRGWSGKWKYYPTILGAR
jgi:hypothetical protein